MPKTYKLTVENSQELREAMSRKENSRHYKKLLAVAMRAEGKDNHEIVSVTGYCATYVSWLVSSYYNNGIKALMKYRDYPNRRNMSVAEEKEFLSQFSESAKSGQIVTAEEIAAAYDKQTGKNHKTTAMIYRVLHRNNWHLITPRREHPGKASEEEIASSKKLTPNMEN